ncbi:MAG: S9 family peptidase [Crocinitomicaceae bacterium]|nr:S9 family peptidase [Crocinitomicaceae bacterium]
MKIIICAFFLLSLQLYAQDLTVEQIWKKYEFYPKGVEGFKSMKDGEHYTKMNEDGSIVKYKLTDPTDAGTLIVNGNSLMYKEVKIAFDDYEFNFDETKILFMTSIVPIYRRSFTAIYYLYDLTTKQLMPLDEKHQPQSLAEYSPDGKSVSFIHGNDIFVKQVANGKVVKLTDDGKRNKIINGTTDWVYEEEFSITKGYDWSPDSKWIAFLRFNEKEVKEFNLTFYNELYPTEYTYKYPKAGEDNSKVTANIVNVSSGKITPINLGEYEYIPRLSWSKTANKLILQTLNRHQNQLNYHLIDLSGKKMTQKMFFEEKSTTYVEIDNNLMIRKDGNSILRTSEIDGFNHIYQLDFNGATTQITKGNWDVIDLYGIDESTNTVYYSCAEVSPMIKTIHSISTNGSNKSLLSLPIGVSDAEFTAGMKFMVLTHSDANTPPVYTLNKNDGSLVLMLEDNKVLKSKLGNLALSKKEFITFDVNGNKLNGWIMKPANFNSTKKYPVYMTLYGGPGHNEVVDAWDNSDYMFHQLLTQKGYIVACVEPRGTLYRGAAFKKSTYLQLGKLETEDLIASAKELQGYPYVDANRIGVMGWSYGGFMASLAITKGADVFKMAVAVAPVTNWRNYDNIYTERFMRTPKENAEGYDANSPVNYVNLMKGKFLLVHGAADDNVHYQNSMELINAMVKADKQFDLFIYPNRNHGIYGGNTRNHLFKMILDFVEENL